MKHLLAVLVLLCAVGLFVGAMGCTPDRPAATASKTGIAPELTLAYTGAATALAVLDTQEAERLAKMPTATDAQIKAAESRVDRLKRARDALKIARAWITGERDGASGRTALRDGVTALQLVVQELQADGVRVPEDVTAGLMAAQAYIATE